MSTKTKSTSSKHSTKKPYTESKLILDDETPWAIKEAYKTMRTNVLLSLPDKGNKVIAFTSAEPNDGKTTNAINFAISLGQIGKRVLIIDCDLRKPAVYKSLAIKGDPGLTDVLANFATLSDSLQHIDKHGIYVLTAGSAIPDPTMILQSEKLKVMFEELSSIFDYVIVDLPPLTLVSDAILFADKVDGYLLVVRHDDTDYRAVSDMMEQFKLAEDAKIIGFVYNGDDTQVRSKGKYGYKKYGYYKYGKYYYEEH